MKAVIKFYVKGDNVITGRTTIKTSIHSHPILSFEMNFFVIKSGETMQQTTARADEY